MLKHRKLLLLFLFISASTIAHAADTPPKDVASLIARLEQLNDKCRGGSGDDPATMKACDDREVVLKQIAAKKWCWGSQEQPEYQKKWQKCSTAKIGNKTTSLEAQEAKRQARLTQRIEDARAMVRETWAVYANSIKNIEIGYKCDVLESMEANLAIRKIQNIMLDEKYKAGLISDTSLDIKKVTDKAISDGLSEANRGACAQMTPASRERLRKSVGDLIREGLNKSQTFVR